MAVVARWYARCTPAWMGNRRQTRISLANTSVASATWKLYPANAVGATDLRVIPGFLPWDCHNQALTVLQWLHAHIARPCHTRELVRIASA